MKTLVTTFKRLTPERRIKFVVLLPVMCLATLIDKVLDLSIVLFSWLRFVVTHHWRDILVVIAAVTIIATPIAVVTHIDQTVPVYMGGTYAQAETYVYINCHEMANNFIVAEDGNVRGYVRADDKNIDRLVAVIAENKISNGEQLITWLSEFRNGDYSNAVEFHNYCWNGLDGEVGYSVDLRTKYK